MAKVPRRGRRKTHQKKVENERDRKVTFSKRYNGLFKKGSELVTLCRSQIAIILFSISGKPLSFASPNLDSVLNKFLNVNQQPDDFITRRGNSYRESKLRELNQEFNEVNEQLANEKKHGHMIQESIKGSMGKTYEEYKESLEIHELMQLKYKMEELKRNLDHNQEATSRASSSNHKYEMDLSKIVAPKDYLKI